MTAADKIAEARGWPERLMIRDTGLHDDLGGPGQRIYTTAGRGYERVAYVRADLADAQAQEIARLRGALEDAELRREIAAFYGNHTWLMRVMIEAAGELPRFNEGGFRSGFEAGIEEVMSRADRSAPEGGTQLQDAWLAIAALMSGQAVLSHVPDGSTAAQWAEIMDPVHKQTADALAQENARLQGALHEAKAALIEVKREMWREAQPKWTMADFLNWAIVQQITSAIARARAALGDTP